MTDGLLNTVLQFHFKGTVQPKIKIVSLKILMKMHKLWQTLFFSNLGFRNWGPGTPLRVAMDNL